MSLVKDYGPLIEHGTVSRNGVTARWELRGTTHPMIYVYWDGGERVTQLGEMPPGVLAGMLLAEGPQR